MLNHKIIAQVEVIGGTDKYMAVCRTCYNLPDRNTFLKTEPVQTTPARGGDVILARQLILDTPPDTPPY